MRIWSIHPRYLDSKGLVALWREALLAKNVLEGKTKGYKNHPQLNRFRATNDALGFINTYLLSVYNESVARGYNFDKNKIGENISQGTIDVTESQLKYETEHLKIKLKIRDPELYETLINDQILSANPIFKLVKGEIESWEIVK